MPDIEKYIGHKIPVANYNPDDLPEIDQAKTASAQAARGGPAAGLAVVEDHIPVATQATSQIMRSAPVGARLGRRYRSEFERPTAAALLPRKAGSHRRAPTAT